MADPALLAELETLRKKIHYHNYLYHTLDQPEISDYEYDQLFNRLKQIEAEHPELVTPDSPTQRSGSQPLDKFTKVQHPQPILSLANGFGRSDALSWYERILKLDPAVADADYILEPKLDGLTVVLHYEDGVFVLGATRGDGQVGEDITENLKTVPTLPLRIPVRGTQTAPARLVVRGEAFITKSDFESLNRELENKGEKTYLNPRNTAAGSLRQLDPAITARRPIKIYVYQIVDSSDPVPETQSALLDYLRNFGLPVNPLCWHARTIEEAIQLCEQEGLKRHEWPYEADGIVIKLNDLSLARRLGVSGKDPRGALAYKYPGVEVETRLLQIQVNVGRTGVLTPLAILEPVTIGGVVVRQATLHNFDFIREKDIRIGDRVLVKRAGEVIPYILASLPEKRDGSQAAFEIPRNCPSCGSTIEKDPEQVAYYCVNTSCPAQIARTLENFASKGAMDITGLGGQVVSQLINSGLIHTAADLYKLTEASLLSLDKFGEKRAQNLIEAIDNSRKQPLARLIIGLGIRGIGEVAAKKLALKFHSLDELSRADEDALQEVEGVGPNLAKSVVQWFSQSQNKQLIEDFRGMGVWPVEESSPQSTGKKKLDGLTFVITGTLPSLSREEASALIETNGGTVSGSVSKKTSYLLLGAEPGSKYTKAVELGVPILSEEDLRRMLE